LLLTLAGDDDVSAQAESATGTFDTSSAAVGITEVLENRITITRDGNSVRAEVAVTVITELPGTVVGSLCRTEYKQSMSASGSIAAGQKVWPFNGTLVLDWQLISSNPNECLGGPTHNETASGFTSTISGTSMTGFVNGMAYTIADASAILDQPTSSPAPAPSVAPTPTTEFDDAFETGEPIELLEKDCFLDPGLRPVIGVVTAVSGTVEVQREVSGVYGPIREGAADAPAAPP
jgi:hypothetical protein